MLDLTTAVQTTRRPLEKPSPVGSSHGYSSASGGFGLLAPSDRVVICRLRSYLLTDFIKLYINKLIIIISNQPNHQLAYFVVMSVFNDIRNASTDNKP